MYIWTSLATLLASVYYFYILMKVGSVRRQVGIAPPVMTGSADLERALRVQGNAVEFAPIFFPALWLTAIWVHDGLAAALGFVWVVGRLSYTVGYLQHPEKRFTGFTIQAIAATLLLLLAFGGMIAALLRH